MTAKIIEKTVPEQITTPIGIQRELPLMIMGTTPTAVCSEVGRSEHASPAGVEGGIPRAIMLMEPQVLRMLEYQDSVSHHDTDQANNAQDARQVEIDMERPQAQRRPEQGEQQRGQGRQRQADLLEIDQQEEEKTMITAIAKPASAGSSSRNPAPWLHPYCTSRPRARSG